ncbi:Hypothetical protein Nlim_0598 [Candidatus Nitrosarchaeum limnium SFB1]|jgi:hypothetical protein|uniref:C2H2-type domain-containing protein n=1 Tax=Candidatus Nitrosarchaeum limnium SFB1 TaxID=886738 RepID=F3KJE0_9ARCH|nr:Hypothetical protein Nlim_0598 [Candidatus Nitrosarchaeum limnium SFB1]
MKSKLSLSKSLVKSVFKRDSGFSNKCKICEMEFTDPERTKKHMIKAHSKPKRDKENLM